MLSLSASYFLRKPLKTTIVAALDVRRYSWGHRAVTTLATIANALFGADVRFQALADAFRVYSDGVTNPILEELASAAAAITASTAERKRLFAEPAFRTAFRRDWRGLGGTFHRRFDEMTILEVPGRPEWRGRTFTDVAREHGAAPLDFFMDAIAEHDDAVRWVTDVGNHRPAVRRRLLAHPTTLPGFSDAGAHARNIGFQDAGLQLLRESLAHPGWMRPEEAVARLTRRPAEWLGLDAGTLEEGSRADIVVLDPEALSSAGRAEPVEQRPDLLFGEMRLVRESHAAVRQVFIGGRRAFDLEAGFHPRLGKEAFGRLVRAGSTTG
jgi:N-acyl-D-aspartate/D-glutamate deacylase